MKSNYLYLLFICVISCLFVSCSDEDNKGEEIPEWNRFRTTNVLVYAHLSEQNLFSSCSYKEVASSIRNTTHSVALLDRTNAVYGQTAIINTGTEAARESKKVPVFVPVSYNSEEKKIIGSTVLFPSTISEMTQYEVENDCRYLETKTEENIDLHFLNDYIDSLAEELPAQRKKIFILSKRQNYTNKEIAEMMGISESTVATQLSLAVKFMREQLMKHYDKVIALLIAFFVNEM